MEGIWGEILLIAIIYLLHYNRHISLKGKEPSISSSEHFQLTKFTKHVSPDVCSLNRRFFALSHCDMESSVLNNDNYPCSNGRQWHLETYVPMPRAHTWHHSWFVTSQLVCDVTAGLCRHHKIRDNIILNVLCVSMSSIIYD